MTERWLQVNVDFGATHDRPAAARAVLDAIAIALDRARRDGAVRHFIFMRKPPGMRLRFGGRLDGALHDVLLQAVRDAARDAGVSRVAVAAYEPEERLFGGPIGMQIAHDHMDADCACWLARDRAARAGSASTPALTWSAAVLNELFAETLRDRGEVWDVWCNVAGTEQADPPGDATRAPLLDDILSQSSVAESLIVRRMQLALGDTARRLHDAALHGVLECGLRGLLATYAAFHFNHHGIAPARYLELARAMMDAWHPRTTMRGASRSS